MLNSILSFDSENFCEILKLFKKHKIDILLIKDFNVFINTKDLYKAIRLLKKNKIDYKILKENSIKNILRKILFYVPIYLILIIIFIFSTFNVSKIEKIKVISEDTQLNYEVKEYIKEKYLENSNSKLNLKDIKMDVISKFKEIGFLEIEIKNNELVLSIQKIKQETIDETNDGKILSTNDAIITKVLVYSGTPIVKVNDTVKKGDILIEDYIINPNVEDNFIKVKASADVYGKVYYTKRLCIPKYRIINNFTGKKNTKYEIHIFKNKILTIGKNNFDKYIVNTTKIDLYSILGVSIVKKIYREIVPTTLEIEDFELEEEIGKMKTIMLENFDENVKVLNSWVIKKCIDNLYMLDIYYEIEQCISIEEEYYRS